MVSKLSVTVNEIHCSSEEFYFTGRYKHKHAISWFLGHEILVISDRMKIIEIPVISMLKDSSRPVIIVMIHLIWYFQHMSALLIRLLLMNLTTFVLLQHCSITRIIYMYYHC